MQNLFYLGLIAIIFTIAGFQQNQSSSVTALQTIPTRTSTPPPTATNAPSNPNPNPTNTPDVPTATATATKIPATLGPTPEGGYIATAVSCSNQPTLIATNPTNIRSGPSTTYDLIGQLIFLEVRPIIGRAQNAEWWQISLAEGTMGWVADAVVTVNGYTDIVPVITTPAGDGPAWNPTPNPSCTVTPTPLPTETATPTATETPLPTETAVPLAQESAIDTAVPPTALPTTVPQPTRVTEPTPLPTAVPLATTNSPSSNNNLLIIGAIGLLLVGGIIAAVTRNKKSNK